MRSYGEFWKKKEPRETPDGCGTLQEGGTKSKGGALQRWEKSLLAGQKLQRWGLVGILILGMVGFFGSCATVPYVQREERVLRLIELINRGGLMQVKGLANTPFLVDGEIVLLQNDLYEFWNNMHASGFVIRSPRVLQNRFATVEDARYIRDSMEVRTFFKKYTDQDTSLVQIGSVDGTYYLLLGREVRGYPRMIGFKGPVQ